MNDDFMGKDNAAFVGVGGIRLIARQYLSAEFRGKNAHAGANPWKGINALDSAVAAYNNISLLRQQIEPEERIHNVMLESEKTVNVIPAYAKAAYQARSPRLAGLKKLTERVVNCINAAALATGTEVEIT
jgi:metal-dependent amidase/aminoacylase/carboxypeptidase family protein